METKKTCMYEFCEHKDRKLPPVGNDRKNGKAGFNCKNRTMHHKCYERYLFGLEVDKEVQRLKQLTEENHNREQKYVLSFD